MRFHEVNINGQKFSFPSSTGIIELARERGYLVGDQWLTYNEETLRQGTMAHKIAAMILEGQKMGEDWYLLPETIRNAIRALIRWRDYTGFRCRQAEFEVASIQHGFVGHPDAIGTIKQHVVITDWTTGKVNTGKLVQIGSYYLAYKEMYPKRSISEGRAVYLDKQTGNFSQEILDESELQELGQDFIKIRERIGVI